MIITIKVCDLCEEIGITKLAVASYRASDGEEYDVCESCLKMVKDAGLLHRAVSKKFRVVIE